jgi:hypothetical protein
MLGCPPSSPEGVGPNSLSVSALWFAGVALSDTRISFEGQSVPVAGARAYVEEDGDVVRRDSPGRLLWHGVLLALRGRMAPRELFLIVEGPGFQFVVPCDPSQAARARSYASAVCSAGARPADAPIRREAGPGFPRSTLGADAPPPPAQPATTARPSVTSRSDL